MAITTFTLRYNSNAFAPRPAGDLTVAIYDVVITAAANNYPAGGEPVDFSGEFAEVHSIDSGLGLSAPVVGVADAVGAVASAFQRAVGAPGLNTGAMRLYQADGAAVGLANLAELAVGAYPNDVTFTLTVHGRPSTSQG